MREPNLRVSPLTVSKRPHSTISSSSKPTEHYLNSILERRTVELREKTAELEKLCVAQYE